MWLLPAFHPAHILRNNRRLDGLGRFDMKQAAALLNGWKPDKPKSSNSPGVGSIPPAAAVCAALRAFKGKRVACDIETNGKHPLVCDIRCIGFWDGSKGLLIPLLHRDGSTIDVPVGKKGKFKKVEVWKHSYTPAEEAQIAVALNELFDSVESPAWSGEEFHKGPTTLYGWNFQFDSLCLRSRLHVRARYTFDGIVAHHVILPYWPHDLGFVTSIYTHFPYYKKTDKGEAWSTKSDRELAIYCMLDCEVTWITCERLRKEIHEREGDVDALLTDHDHRYVRECEDWREVGIAVDTDVLLLLKEHYGKVEARALARMQEVAKRVASAQGSDNASEALEVLVAGEVATEEEGGEASHHDGAANLDTYEENDDSEPQAPFKPGSLPQLRLLLAAIGVPLSQRTETGVISTKKELLLEARKELIDLGAKSNDLRIAFLDYLFAWREAGKISSTFLRPELIDGRLHCSFSVHVVPSGRISSKNSNLTNQPKEIRSMFACLPGHRIVAGDWDALEMRIVAYIASELALISAFDAYDAGTGPKIHKVNTSAIFGIPLEGMDTDDPKIAPLYRASKAVFYLISYGGGPHTAYDTAQKEMPDLSWEAFSACFNRLKAKYPILFQWQKEHVARVAASHVAFSDVNKRKMWFFEPIMDQDTEEAAATLNYPIQCVLGSTRVITDAGYLPVSSLVGRKFNAWTGKRWAPATAVAKGVAEIFEARLARGFSLYCDTSHKIKVPLKDSWEWREVGKTRLNTRLAIDLARPLEFGCTEVDLDDAYYLGLWLSDGSVTIRSTSCNLQFTIGNTKHTGNTDRGGSVAVERLLRWATSKGMRPSVKAGQGCKNVVCYAGGDAWLFGYGADTGWKAHTKRVPDSVWSWGLEARKSFLRGVLDGDGYYHADIGVSLHMCQLRLLQELWLLFRTVGVDGHVDRKPHMADRKGHEAYRLTLSASQSFASLGWGSEGSTRRQGLSPRFEALRVLDLPRVDKRSTCSEATIRSRIKHGGSANPYTLAGMGLSDTYDLTSLTCFRSRRIRMPVYTLVVDHEDHSYVANGVISRNSSAADVVSNANIRVLDRSVKPTRKRLKKGEVLRQLGQIHDELLFEVPTRIASKFKDDFKRIAEEEPDSAHKWRLPVDVRTKHRWAAVDIDLLLLKEGEEGAPCLLQRALVEAPKAVERAAFVALKLLRDGAPEWLKVRGRKPSTTEAVQLLRGAGGTDTAVEHVALRVLGKVLEEELEDRAEKEKAA